jgi:two-component system cell cycle sensor histidine kinase/response regulator CckA
MAKILIADDDLTNRQLLVKLLGYADHHLLEASNGAEAMEIVRTHRPDLVISDIRMADMDGFEFVRQLRLEPAVTHTSVMSCTAIYHTDDKNQLARACGVLHILEKPVRPDVVLRAVNEVLGLPPSSPAVLTNGRAQQAQKLEALGRLAGGVAHDFNNLLTVISGCSDLLLRGVCREGPARSLVEEIKKAGERAADLTRQLLAFSRKQVLAPVVLNLNSLVSDTEKMLRRLLGEDIDLATTLDPALQPVKADPGQVQQILLNLAVNARDAMPQGGKLTIETANAYLDAAYTRENLGVQPGPYVLLAVSDNGCGMDRVTMARIFEPFFTTKEPGKGTGLGLATVHGIIKQSGGHVAVYSERGHGTTFKVYLPPAEEAGSAPAPQPSSLEAPRGKETVLLVEDEESVRLLTHRVLQRQGYTVLVACCGEEALTISQQYQQPIHLLVTDVVMPKMSGPQLASQLKRLRPGIKVLCLSGYTDSAMVRHGMLQSDRHFLPKPFSPTDLARKVRELLDA